MPNPSRQKGDRLEREIVQLFQRHNILAKRTPMSGAIAGWEGDVIIKIGDKSERIECKRRKAGFGTIYRWLAGNYLLAIRDDQTEPLIVMRAADFVQIVAELK